MIQSNNGLFLSFCRICYRCESGQNWRRCQQGWRKRKSQIQKGKWLLGQGVRLWGLWVMILFLWKWILSLSLHFTAAAPLVMLIIKNSLFARWTLQRRGWGRGVRTHHSGAGWVWLGQNLDGGGGSPVLEEGDSQILLIQVFSLTPYFLHPTLHLCLLPMISCGILNLSFSRGCISYIRLVICGRRWSAWGGRQSTWKSKASR